MSEIDQLIRDARMALETIELAANRKKGQFHATASAEWLERIAREIAREMREGMNVPAEARRP